MNPPVYEATALAKAYDAGSVAALRGVDLRVEDGEFVAIMGPSGSGKTTLLHLLGSLDAPTSGTLKFRGEPLPGPSVASEYRARHIGLIFQAFHLLPAFTALENVQLPMLEGPLRVRERLSRAEALLASVGMGERANHLPGRMSGGERQRVAIARSLANDPKVLLADEPTGNLDSENAAAVMDLLAALHRDRGVTLVLITHDPSVAARAQRIVRMKDGRILEDPS